jgi:16S rRNA G966 N2-methylase RsmD
LTDDGIIITEHDLRNEMPEETDSLEKLREKRYGKTVLSIYRKKVLDEQKQTEPSDEREDL